MALKKYSSKKDNKSIWLHEMTAYYWEKEIQSYDRSDKSIAQRVFISLLIYTEIDT